MTPEATLFLAKARTLLAEATTMLSVDLNAAAARTSYLAGFHAAQALLSEQHGKTFKTHKGVHVEFLRATKDDPAFLPEFRTFLSRTFDFKVVADYGISPSMDISADEAKAAVETATRFVAHLAQLLHQPV